MAQNQLIKGYCYTYFWGPGWGLYNPVIIEKVSLFWARVLSP